MKKILFIILFSLSVFSFSQERKIIFSPDFIYQHQFLAGGNLIFAKVDTDGFSPMVEGFRVGVESNLGSKYNFIIAPKVGYEISTFPFMVRLSAIHYFQNDRKELRLLPEIGLSFFSVVNLTYGYGIRLTNSQVNGLNNHRIALSINLDRYLFSVLR